MPVATTVVVNNDSNEAGRRSGAPSPAVVPTENDAIISHIIKPLNLEGGQCYWCGIYGHASKACLYLK
ncbi:hypothetical protein BD408DRAFT_430022 [Parasitella parasitica]|nr:hypothetical protein BD408DRAFT_430022 [Parasitella parasitica]